MEEVLYYGMFIIQNVRVYILQCFIPALILRHLIFLGHSMLITLNVTRVVKAEILVNLCNPLKSLQQFFRILVASIAVCVLSCWCQSWVLSSNQGHAGTVSGLNFFRVPCPVPSAPWQSCVEGFFLVLVFGLVVFLKTK